MDGKVTTKKVFFSVQGTQKNNIIKWDNAIRNVCVAVIYAEIMYKRCLALNFNTNRKSWESGTRVEFFIVLVYNKINFERISLSFASWQQTHKHTVMLQTVD
jgi:hypothetical protein